MLPNRYHILNSFDLKMIALLTMVIDHLGAIFFPEIGSLRIIGRVAFFLYAFMIAEGIYHTKNIKKYIYKLFLWAIISEIPFDFAFFGKVFYFDLQNIFWTLLISVIPLSFFRENHNIYLKLFLLISAPIIALLLKFDYSWYGVLLIYCFYFFKNKYLYQTMLISYLSFTFAITSFFFQIFFFLGLIPTWFYNGKLGKKTGNWYYSFYAIHIAVFGIINYFIKN